MMSINAPATVPQPISVVRPLLPQEKTDAPEVGSVPTPTLPGQQAATPAIETALTAANKSDKDKPSKDQVQNALETINDSLKNLQNQSSSLVFTMDHDLGKVIVRLVDTTTKEVIRQYPPEELLEIARQMDKLVGKLLKEKA